MIRNILIAVRGDGKGDNVFAHAAALARRFKAHVEVTHCRPRAEDLLPYGVPIPGFLRKQLFDQVGEVADQEGQGLEDEVNVLAKKLRLRMTDKPSGKSASASWVEESGRQVDVIKRHGRLADIICVAKPDIDRNLGANTLKSALFHAGRPVMMCPHAEGEIETLGSTVAIAWNGSVEASRAVALTSNLIEGADKVFILSAGEEVHGATTSDLVDYMKMRGVNPEIVRFNKGPSLGKQLLEQAGSAGADLLIMGAYGDSHERETVFGGNTQAVVDNATMPVVMVH